MAAIIVWIIAVLSIATSLIPPIRRRDDIIRDVTEVIALPVIPYLTWGVLLWVVASSLNRRKRVALVTVVVLEMAQVITGSLLLLVWFLAPNETKLAEGLTFPGRCCWPW